MYLAKHLFLVGGSEFNLLAILLNDQMYVVGNTTADLDFHSAVSIG